jgi:hypothetical protein
MPKKVKDLAVKTGSYTDRNGDTKHRWKNVGVMLKYDDGGFGILFDRSFNPAGIPPYKDGADQIAVSLFDPKQQDGHAGFDQPAAAPAPARSAPAPAVDIDDAIPF